MSQQQNERVPKDIMKIHQLVTLAIVSRHLKFGMVKALSDQQVGTIALKLESIIGLHRHPSFQVKTILADPEFKAI